MEFFYRKPLGRRYSFSTLYAHQPWYLGLLLKDVDAHFVLVLLMSINDQILDDLDELTGLFEEV